MSSSVWSRLTQAWKDRSRRRRLVVTDVTRMEGERVCVAGFLEDGRVVRPVFARGGPTESWLHPAFGDAIEPFTIDDPSRRLPPGVATIFTDVAFSVVQLSVTLSPEATASLEAPKLRILAAFLVSGGVLLLHAVPRAPADSNATARRPPN